MTSIASFSIHAVRTLGPLSPIRLLSIFTLLSCFGIILTALEQRFAANRGTVFGLCWAGAGAAGMFALPAGRIMPAMMFGDGSAPVSGSAAAGPPGFVAIVTHAPPWVWPLFALILWLGFSKTRPRTVAKWRLLGLPAVFMGLGIGSFLLHGFSLETIAALAGTLAVGSLAGRALAHRDNAVVDARGRVHLEGEYVSLVLVLVIFLARFAGKAAQAIHPALAGDPRMAMAMAAITGFSVGLTATRSLINTGLLRTRRDGLRHAARTRRDSA